MVKNKVLIALRAFFLPFIYKKTLLSAKDIKDNGKYAISAYAKRINGWNNFLKSINEL